MAFIGKECHTSDEEFIYHFRNACSDSYTPARKLGGFYR